MGKLSAALRPTPEPGAASSSDCPDSGWNGWATRRRKAASPASGAFACGFHGHVGDSQTSQPVRAAQNLRGGGPELA
jgi:hypothetical protein